MLILIIILVICILLNNIEIQKDDARIIEKEHIQKINELSSIAQRPFHALSELDGAKSKAPLHQHILIKSTR